MNGTKTFTNTGNMRSPGFSVVKTWLGEIWQEMSLQIIRKSFDPCGITSVQNGDLHNQLRHYVLRKQIVEELIDENLGFMPFEEFEALNESVDFEDNEELIFFNHNFISIAFIVKKSLKFYKISNLKTNEI